MATRLVDLSVMFALAGIYVGFHFKTLIGKKRPPLPLYLALLPVIVVAVFFLSCPCL